MEICIKNSVIKHQIGWIKKCTNISPNNYATALCFCPDYPIPIGVTIDKIKVVTTQNIDITLKVVKFNEKPTVDSIGEQVGDEIVIRNVNGEYIINALPYNITSDSLYTYIAMTNLGWTAYGDDVQFAVSYNISPNEIKVNAVGSSYCALSLGYK